MLALSVGSAQAVVVYTNLGEATWIGGGSTATSFANGSALAQSFTTDANYYKLNSATLLMNQSEGASVANVTIWSDDTLGGAFPAGMGDGPLAQLFALNTTAVTTLGLYTFNAPTYFELAPNSTYWVVLASSNNIGTFNWEATESTASTGPVTSVSFANGIPGNWTVADNSLGPYKMELDATTVPEPSTYALLVISLGVVGYARKRMNTKA